jgi:hypothetical protein
MFNTLKEIINKEEHKQQSFNELYQVSFEEIDPFYEKLNPDLKIIEENAENFCNELYDDIFDEDSSDDIFDELDEMIVEGTVTKIAKIANTGRKFNIWFSGSFSEKGLEHDIDKVLSEIKTEDDKKMIIRKLTVLQDHLNNSSKPSVLITKILLGTFVISAVGNLVSIIWTWINNHNGRTEDLIEIIDVLKKKVENYKIPKNLKEETAMQINFYDDIEDDEFYTKIVEGSHEEPDGDEDNLDDNMEDDDEYQSNDEEPDGDEDNLDDNMEDDFELDDSTFDYDEFDGDEDDEDDEDDYKEESAHYEKQSYESIDDQEFEGLDDENFEDLLDWKNN